MAHKDTIISYITEHNAFYCDDCLSNLCCISPRQTVFQLCTKLSASRKINRSISTCSYCGKKKTINSIAENTYINSVDTAIIKQRDIDRNNNKTKKLNKKFIYDANKFIEVKLEFENFDIKDTFSRFNAHTLAEILIKDKYRKLEDECNCLYGSYMNMELGKFVNILKQDNKSLYKKFLNPYGDQLFCKFRMEETSLAKYKGLYMYKYNGQIMYIGRVKDSFYQRINAGYANISPKNCYIDGQATNCHINAIINKVGEQIRFYVIPLEDDEEICSLEKELIVKNQPEWNIALK